MKMNQTQKQETQKAILDSPVTAVPQTIQQRMTATFAVATESEEAIRENVRILLPLADLTKSPDGKSWKTAYRETLQREGLIPKTLKSSETIPTYSTWARSIQIAKALRGNKPDLLQKYLDREISGGKVLAPTKGTGGATEKGPKEEKETSEQGFLALTDKILQHLSPEGFLALGQKYNEELKRRKAAQHAA